MENFCLSPKKKKSRLPKNPTQVLVQLSKQENLRQRWRIVVNKVMFIHVIKGRHVRGKVLSHDIYVYVGSSGQEMASTIQKVILLIFHVAGCARTILLKRKPGEVAYLTLTALLSNPITHIHTYTRTYIYCAYKIRPINFDCPDGR